MGTLNQQSNGPVYSNTVIGTLAKSSPLLAVPNVTARPSTASVPISYYLIWHYNIASALQRANVTVNTIR